MRQHRSLVAAECNLSDMRVKCESNVPAAFNEVGAVFTNVAGSSRQNAMLQVQEKWVSGGLGCSGDPLVIRRVYTLVDAMDHPMKVCSHTITVEDDEPPAITCSEVAQGTSCEFAFGTATAKDNCGLDVGLAKTFYFEPFEGSNHIVNAWTATDACGNTASCTQRLVCEDQ